MYLGSLQIHESQEVIVNNKDEYRIKLRMHATYDLIKEILSYGEDVEVIAPTSLKNEIQRRYKSAMKLYS
jgi:predicted DNA-binding transcriptional regulator YafY